MEKPTAESIGSNKEQPTPPPEEEMEEELARPRFVPINRRKNAMEGDGANTFGGINKAPSVFEKGTLFDTRVN
ncbi:hypothetical protein RFF05_09910 [Bengtsoniella intestinalis]|uniref:hypothetical protein n=1 Tax=Bengtsoniella intestinalis TaxID=3073143 RepID=UPI00391F4AEB